METKEYFEKIMQDYNQNRKDRNPHSIIQMKEWLVEYKPPVVMI